MHAAAIVSLRGAARWASGHPWIFRSDIHTPPTAPAGPVDVRDQRGKPLGVALWSPHSEISLRLLDSDPDARLDAHWWHNHLSIAIARRHALGDAATAYRLVHAEGDGLPSLIVDRYDRWLVVQLLSAGLEHFRGDIVAALLDLTRAEGILARNDASVRAREGLERTTELLAGSVPEAIEVAEHGVRYIAAPYTGQKTGAFLDQRENRRLVGEVTRGIALDCFSYHGSFALHAATRAERVIAIDSSAAALTRAADNARLNAIENIAFVEANAFDYLREAERAAQRFDTIILDPPAFAKSRGSLADALRGYKEINLRALKLLAPGGVLFTASCSYHVTKPLFLEMLQAAAADSGRRVVLRETRGQPLDHPELLTVPETGYLKGALLEVTD